VFFPELIKNISDTDRVLEIGPGATPHPRSDVFLERNYDDNQEKFAQTGYHGELKTEKPIFFYDENAPFPFKDKEFDYVICSHVIEHVGDVEHFISEMCRVSKKGYMEFPAVYYEFLYNFNEHRNICYYDQNSLIYFEKDAHFHSLKKIQKLFWDSLYKGYYYLADDFKDVFFMGFEWNGQVNVKRANNLDDVVPNHESLQNRVLNIIQKKQPARPAPVEFDIEAKHSKLYVIRKIGSKIKRLILSCASRT
jgi:SAM-dependent methyltransferase